MKKLKISKKLVIFTLVLALTMSSISVFADKDDMQQNNSEAFTNESNDSLQSLNKIEEDIEKNIYKTLSAEEIKFLKSLENDDAFNQIVSQNSSYKDRIISLEITDLNDFSKKTGLTLKETNQYITSLNKILDIVNESSKKFNESKTQNSMNYYNRYDYVERVGASSYDAFYGQASTQRLKNNISRKVGFFTGISLIGGYFNKYVGVASGIFSVYTAGLYKTIDRNFVNSGYRGVINRVVKIPLGFDFSYWRPLGTAFDPKDPNK